MLLDTKMLLSTVLGVSVGFAPGHCTDGCEATASVVSIPGGACGNSMPAWGVDWQGATSGHCDGCQVISHCHNEAVITIAAAAGTRLHGGGFVCEGNGGQVFGTIDTCGKASVLQIQVHGGAPCDGTNIICTVYLTLGCKNC